MLYPEIHNTQVLSSELRTLAWDILNPDRFINLEINNKRKTSLIKKNRRSSTDLDIRHSKAFSSDHFPQTPIQQS